MKEVYMRVFVELGNAMMRKEAVQNERSHLQPYDKANMIVLCIRGKQKRSLMADAKGQRQT